MKKFLIPIVLTVLILSACATETPPPSPTTVPATDTSVPATATNALATETTVPTVEAILPTDTAVVDNPTAPISFVNQVAPIINLYCVECHGGVRIREGLNLTTYDGLMAGSDNGAVVIPGNANDSLFVDLIEQGEMPDRGPAPSAAELQILIDWINQGALNN